MAAPAAWLAVAMNEEEITVKSDYSPVKPLLMLAALTLVVLGTPVAIFYYLSPPGWPSYQRERQKVIDYCDHLVAEADKAMTALGHEMSLVWANGESTRCYRALGLTQEYEEDYQRFEREQASACKRRLPNPNAPAC